MIYDDGCKMDKDMRVTECPRCHNTEFSAFAKHCRICGQSLFNLCSGCGNDLEDVHQNPGNARFCEECGAKTQFFLDNLLKPWEDVCREQGINVIHPTPKEDETLQQLQTGEEDELPF